MGGFFFFVGMIIVMAILSPIFWLMIRYVLAELAEDNILVTFREDGKFKFITQGGTDKAGRVVKIIYRLNGWKLEHCPADPKNPWQFKNRPQEVGDMQRGWFETLFGVYWIGFPPHQIWEYSFSYDREIRPNDPPDKKGYRRDDKQGIMHRTSKTDYLAFQFVYPIVIEEIELARGFRITIRGAFTVRVFDPYTAVIVLRGDWFPKVRSAIEGALINAVKGMEIETFQKEDKVGIPGAAPSFLEKAILDAMALDTSVKFSSGMEVISFDFKDYAMGIPAEQEAFEAQKLAELEANAKVAMADGEARATVARAKGQADADRLLGDAEAYALRQKADVMNASAASRDLAIAEQFAQALTNTKVSTLVLGGKVSGPILPTPPTRSDESKPAPASKTP